MVEVLEVVDGVILVFEIPAEEAAQELQLFLHSRVLQPFRLSKKVEILCQLLLAKEVKEQTESVTLHPLHLSDMVPHGGVLLTAALGPSFRITLSVHEIMVSTLEVLAVLCLGSFISKLGGIGTSPSFIVFHGTGQSGSQRRHSIDDLLVRQHLPLTL